MIIQIQMPCSCIFLLCIHFMYIHLITKPPRYSSSLLLIHLIVPRQLLYLTFSPFLSNVPDTSVLPYGCSSSLRLSRAPILLTNSPGTYSLYSSLKLPSVKSLSRYSDTNGSILNSTSAFTCHFPPDL